MAYDFQRLADVELLEEVPDGASAFVAVNGVVKRVPGSGLGGGGVATAILRLASESNASAKAVKRVAIQPIVKKLPIMCDNYTYAQARAVLEAGNPFAAMLYKSDSNSALWSYSLNVSLTEQYIAILFYSIGGSFVSHYWNADGFFDGNPADYKP